MADNCNAAAVQAVSQANNNFNFHLYQQLATEPGNLFYSPFSIEIILALLYFGARGETQKQLADGLYLPNDKDAVEDGFTTILNELKDTSGVNLDIASKIYLQDGFSVLSEFRASAENLGTETEELDFVNETEQSRNKINDWVEEKTNGKIKDLFPEGVLSALTRMVLANAIYFKGNWTYQFKEALTTAMPFYSSCKETKNTDTMYMENVFNYTYMTDLQTQAIAIPYKGGEISMVILLPKKNNGLSDLEANLSNIKLSEIVDQMQETDVNLFLPKFTVEWQKELTSVLQQMGITTAFSGNADFSGITDKRGLKVSSILHKSYIEVNEEGTEAAAATGSVISLTSAVGANQRVIFRADHPFLYFIVNVITKTILFAGRLSVPT